MSRGRTQFWKNFAVSSAIGVAVTFGIWYVQRRVGDQATITLGISVLSGMIATYGFFMYITWRDDYWTLSGALDEHIARLLVGNPYSDLIGRQLQLHWQLSNVFRSIVDEFSKRKGGAIVIAANSNEYLSKLQSCLQYGKQSFEAIVRGGGQCLYRPRWFFCDERGQTLTDAQGRLRMSELKRVYLDHVNKAKFNAKVRIMIFPEGILKEDFGNMDIREQYLELNRNVELYWLRQEDAEAISVGDRHWEEVWKQYLQDDFAIIDSLVLKHMTLPNGDLLFVSIADQVEPYKEIFRQLELYKENSMAHKFHFFRITESGVDDTPWSDWLR